jgi:hypothetical protein
VNSSNKLNKLADVVTSGLGQDVASKPSVLTTLTKVVTTHCFTVAMLFYFAGKLRNNDQSVNS